MEIFRLSGKQKQIQLLQIQIKGAVQGVGFRPFVYRLANNLGLTGRVRNSPQGVTIEIEGERQKLKEFIVRVQSEKPPLSSIHTFDYTYLAAAGYADFKVEISEQDGQRSAVVLPDIAICNDCLAEILDPGNRRYLYPFTNCTNCGPRFSIIESLPYDRENTTMKEFAMCSACRKEYENPMDRRFHAQPIACPECGPHLELWDSSGETLKTHHDTLLEAAGIIRDGMILALKGLGGFQLVVDARNKDAVRKLRFKKSRPEKPFAVMYPGLIAAGSDCEISELERKLLNSPESPIVLLKRRFNKNPETKDVVESVAPGNPWLGVMLPYTPLHYLLMRELGFPVVATSGNYSDESICYDEQDALKRLSDIADFFLVHNRPIARPADDSVVRVIMNKQAVLRRARGYAPLPINSKYVSAEMVAVGGQQKNAIAIARDGNMFISQHIGDLDNKLSYETFVGTVDSLSKLFDLNPRIYVCDKHPDYNSSRFAHSSGRTTATVQHHYAHVMSCMAENGIEEPVLGIAWDGTGHGDDSTIWGGEFLKVENRAYSRFAHLLTFPLPGGEKAIVEPWRTGIGLLYEILEDGLFENPEYFNFLPSDKSIRGLIRRMLEQKINTPVTSSMGRLFDGVASMLGLCQKSSFEGQAATMLEFAIGIAATDNRYDFKIDKNHESYVIDWTETIFGILDDLKTSVDRGVIAAKFHNTTVEYIVEISCLSGINKVVLSGGCFQNRYLTERAITRLRKEGFAPYWHSLMPANDGGICLGQLYAESRKQGGR